MCSVNFRGYVVTVSVLCVLMRLDLAGNGKSSEEMS